jgi:tetratricopeptide (TPR) repeat protein
MNVRLPRIRVVTMLPTVVFLAAMARASGFQTAGTMVPSEPLSEADNLLKEGNLSGALSLLTRMASHKPELPGVEARLGRVYYENQDYERAVAHLQTALEQDPGDAESTQLLGLSYYLSGQVQRAIPLLEKVQSWLPAPDVSGSYILGVSFIDLHDLDKARAAFAKMFSVPPDSAAAHLALAQMLIRQHLEGSAVPELQRSLVLNPHLPMAHFLVGEIDLAQSKTQQALDEFHKELAVNPLLWLAYWRIGDAYARLQKWDEAEQALKQSIWINENFTSPYILLGRVEISKGLPQVAVDFLQRALKMDPNNSSAHYLLGTAFQKLGRKADAEREFALTQSLNSAKDHP